MRNTGQTRRSSVAATLVLHLGLTFVALAPASSHAEGLPSDLGSAWTAPSEFTAPPQLTPISSARVRDIGREIRLTLGDPRITGHTLAAQFVDLASDTTLFEESPTTWLKPASNTKMFTTAAALELLGSFATPSSRVVSSAPLRDGSIEGDVYLFGNHDLTWSLDFYPSSNFVVDRLIEQLEAAGIERIQGDVIVRGLFVVAGQRFGRFGWRAHALQAAERFRLALAAAGIHVYGETRVEDDFDLPDSALTYAEWSAVPVSVIVAYINRLSHNEYADALIRWIGYADTGVSSNEAGFVAIRRWAESRGFDTAHLSLYDGSGLSHDNRISASALIGVHRYMMAGLQAEIWRSSLSAAGLYGTYALRMSGENTIGRVFCKSGTIDGVITGTGILRNRFDNRDYLFAMLMNDVRNQPAARGVQDAVIEVLAGDQRRRGATPVAPFLRSVTAQSDAVIVDYVAAPGADRCDVWIREPDEAQWTWIAGRNAAIDRPMRLVPPNSRPISYRVACSNEAGTGLDSDVYIAAPQSMSQSRRVLLVDGNDRWEEEPAEENELHEGHNFLTAYAGALAGDAVSSIHQSAIPSADVASQNYDLVIWAWGEQGSDWHVCSDEIQRWFERYSALGGAIFASGSEAAWQICAGEEGGRSFLNSIFSADFVSDDAGTRVAKSSSEAGGDVLYFLDPHGMFVGFPDALRPLSGATSCASYLGGSSQTACVLQSGPGSSTAFVGFPAESVVDDTVRATWLRSIFEQLD